LARFKKKNSYRQRKRYIDSVVGCITDKNIIAAYHLTRNMKCRKTLDASENETKKGIPSSAVHIMDGIALFSLQSMRFVTLKKIRSLS